MKRITKHEYNSVIFLLPRPLFLGLGIYRIIHLSGSYFWLSIILGILFGLFLNIIFKKLADIKLIKKSISIILLVYCLYTLTSAVSTLYLNITPKIIILITLLLMIIYSRMKSKTTIFKVANILFIISIGLFIFTLLTLFPLIDITNFTSENSFILKNILIASLYFAFLSTLPYITLPDFKEKYNHKIYLLSCIYTLLLFTLIIGILGVPVASIYKYPEYIIYKKISILNIIENVQNILFMSWIFESFTILGIASNNLNKKILLFILIAILIIYSLLITRINNIIF